MLPLIHWSVALELRRIALSRSEQMRLEHLAEIKYAAKETKTKSSQQPQAEAEIVTASCCEAAAQKGVVKWNSSLG